MKKWSDFIYEMANVPEQGHGFQGLKFNILQPGDKKIKHAPRIKVFRVGKTSKESYVIRLHDGKIMKRPNEEFLDSKELINVQAHIIENKEEYLRLWHDSDLDWSELNLT